MEGIKFKGQTNSISVDLFVIRYKDNEGVYYVYSPQLDLNGYGNDANQAMEHFESALGDFLDYTIEHQTIKKVLNELGWDKNEKSIDKTKSILNSKEVAGIIAAYPAYTSYIPIEMPFESIF